MDDIGTQFDKLMNKAMPNIDEQIMIQMNAFGEEMVDNIIPLQAGFKNLTGNTITSFAYGVYLNKELQNIGLYDGKSAIRWKLTDGEVFKGVDYDGNEREMFYAEIATDLGYGKNTSIDFLENYVPSGYYAIVFTTGTEYSVFLENKLKENVLSNARTWSISSFINSFKPIK